MQQFKRPIPFVIFLSLIAITYSLAQESCAALVNEALARSEVNCLDLQRNQACYANTLVGAAFVEEDAPDDLFTSPTDRAAVAQLASITTAPYDPDSTEWGVALMSVQANLPETLPGQSVTFVLLGDTEVEDGVASENFFEPSAGVEVVVAASANVRSGPGFNFNIFTLVENGATILADGLDESGEWVRVAANNRVGWLNIDVLAASASDLIAGLPTLTPNLRTPMQTFYLRTGIGGQDCDNAPDVLMIDGPDDIEIDLTVNGANIRVGSTILLRILSPGDIMELIVVEGEVQILDENYEPTGVVIREGFRTQACLTPPEDLGKDGDDNDRLLGCPFEAPEPVDLENWCVVDGVLTVALNEGEEIGCEDTEIIVEQLEETEEPSESPDTQTAASTPEPEVTPEATAAPTEEERENIVIGIDPPDPCSSDPLLDPVSNSNANACYAGGSLGGRCDNTDVDQDGDVDQDDVNFMYSVGWHLIRYECGLVDRGELEFIEPMLPPETPVPPEPTEEVEEEDPYGCPPAC